MSTPSWQEQVADKRRRLQEAIPKEWLITPPPDDKLYRMDIPETCGILTSRELEITNTADVAVLLQKLATSEWSSVEVTTAFCKRAIIAHQLVNCLAEVFFDRALRRAAELDEYLVQHGTVIGPLHGLPISLKDQFPIKGLETTMGYAAWIGKFATEDAALVQLLDECGAILYVRTNVPQTLMWAETYNNVFGRTMHPHNINYTSGGSSGGESALIALHGSLLGAGSDIGGSIRIPSHFCGVFGFKPSCYRLPSYGIVNSLDGQETIPTSIGPMSASLSGIKVFMQAILSRQPWRKDPNTIRAPWDQDAYALKEHGNGQKLCFGILWNDGIMIPQPPIRRALEEVKRALEQAGHTCIDWIPLKHGELVANARSIWLSDGGADYKEALVSGEHLINSMNPDADPLDVPVFRRPRDPLSSFQVWKLSKERRKLRKAYLDQWESTKAVTGTGRPIDALICPAAPYPAVRHGQTRSSFYTIPWNTLNYPSLVIPVTKVVPSLDTKPERHEFLSVDDEAVYNMYDSERCSGLPVGLQLIGQAYQEEVVLAIGEIVTEALRAKST
ncbi:general amidase [Obba rivulosa]|uniref:amidase n=1 Tax=Obba rivulosa TaxID=1052685 RepID=A0A8E2DV56_9APHY|nr:general amidase [Obba rivulosa]